MTHHGSSSDDSTQVPSARDRLVVRNMIDEIREMSDDLVQFGDVDRSALASFKAAASELSLIAMKLHGFVGYLHKLVEQQQRN